MAVPSSKPAPFTEVTDDEAILNFIFNPRGAFIGAAVPNATNASEKMRIPLERHGIRCNICSLR
jgi:hypothetical protein